MSYIALDAFSKVMVFSKGRLPINLNFKINNMELEIVSEFIYLGTMFQRTGSFKKNKIKKVSTKFAI
jgi:hypothetical protein